MKLRLIITLTLLALLTACDYIIVHNDDNGKTIADYSYAIVQADALAKGWNAAAYPIETTAVWTDQNGRLGDSADNPSWMFYYYIEGATTGFFANLLLTGDVITGYLTGNAPPSIEGSYDDASVVQWMQVALDAFKANVDGDLSGYDFCWRLFSYQGRDVALVYFFTAADQAGLSDYYDRTPTAWVQLNAETNQIEVVSW